MVDTCLPDQIALNDFVEPGDRLLLGHSAVEPLALIGLLNAEADQLRVGSTFIGLSVTEALLPEAARHLKLRGFGGAGRNSRFARDGSLEILPMHYAQVPAAIRDGLIPVDVALLTVSPISAGRYTLGVVADYLGEAARRARCVIVEVNDRMPETFGDSRLEAEGIVPVVRTSRPLPESPVSELSDIDHAIGANVARLIPDGATIQIGLGSIAESVLRNLFGKRNLGIHTGVIGDALVDLVESGIVTGRYKEADEGLIVTGSFLGTSRLYGWAHRNHKVIFRSATYTHDPVVLGRFANFFSVNSAIEIDLTGQVNAEVAAGRHIGMLGGHADFVRAGVASRNGRSIIAIPSTASRGSRSRIVSRLQDGVVTTSRGDVDTVVTEFGIAELRGLTLTERARALIAIAHPDHRPALASGAENLL